MADHVWRMLSAAAAGMVVVVLGVDVQGVGAATAPRVTPGAAYVALGDSFASGEGSFSYLSGTDQSSDRCHQATNGYVEQFAAKLNMTSSFAFGACSGAIIDDLYKSDHDVWSLNSPTPDDPANDVPAQLPGELGPGTQIVTLSIGGNNAGFVPLVSDCVYNKNFASGGATGQPGCRSRDADAADTLLGYLANGRPAGCMAYYPSAQPDNRQGYCGDEPSLAEVYQRVAALAPNAAIYVTTYPHLFTPPKAANCKVGSAGRGTLTYVIASADAAWLNTETDALNTVIRNAASAASTATHPIHVIDPPAAFNEHGVCSNKPWINGAMVSGTNVRHESFHPNATGQDEWYATIAAQAVPATIPSPVITSINLPAGQVGTLYSTRLTTADNRNGTWSLEISSPSDNFPAGLALTGDTISGTPTAAGSYTFGIAFTDTAGEVASTPAEITIAPSSSPAHGVVWAWGTDQAGQLGDGGGTYAVSSPQLVPGLSDVITVQSGASTAYAVLGDGAVVSWGGGAFGARGNTSLTTTPAPVTGLANVVAVDGGYNSGYALKTDGTVWCWGYGRQGQLGNGADANSTTPVQASGLTDVIAIAAGEYSAYALKSDGTVWSWGSGTGGQLGNGDTVNSWLPVQVSGLSTIVSIGAGYSSGYAVDAAGKVYGWGVGSSGEIGPSGAQINSTPVQISGLPAVATVTGGFATGFAIATDGTLWSWGTGRSAQSLPSPTPAPVAIPGGATSVSVNADTTFVVTGDGVWSWGAGSYGQLGNGTTTVMSPTPVRVNTPTGVTQVAAGELDGYALATPQ